MSKLRILLFSLLLLSPLPSQAEEGSLIGRMQNIEPSLVEIRTVYARTLKKRNGRAAIASYERHGAGIIIDPSGIIVTNTHIIANAPHTYVGLSNGKILEATVLYSSEADFSFLKIKYPHPLKAITWADSSEAKIGQSIIALGSSDYNYQSILGGEITSLIESRSSGAIELLELNLNLYEGDSGGPILDQEGHLLGLVMAKRKTQDRKSYAIASNKIRQEYLKYR
ncbi:MAG: trypsin-like peptidase domain-containing protein [Candidatus Omnitrophica bacterium]|nr:trypsin-like peptidase domain-containing protein [Candidatus Omnitrophota bacterium]